MDRRSTKNKWIYALVTSAAGALALYAARCMGAGTQAHYFGGALVMLTAIAVYFLGVRLFQGDWLDMQAVFSGSWLFTIGMAALRLCRYQHVWEDRTWLLFWGTLAAFLVGNALCVSILSRVGENVCQKAQRRFGHVFALQKNRLYSIALTVTLISFACFAANAVYKGYIPFFTDAKDAYLTFSSKLHILSVAGTSVSGLCYYCIRRCELNKKQKTIMVLCIVYLVILMPLLVVSRGTLIIAAVSLTGSVFYLHDKKFLALLLCLVITFAGYEVGTQARGLGQQETEAIFEPEDHTVVLSKKLQLKLMFHMDGGDAFLYSYFTVSHDNTDMAVKHAQYKSHGARQLFWLDQILEIPALRHLIWREYYTVKENLNTSNLIGFAYYDFGLWGACAMAMLWSMLFEAAAWLRRRREGPFILLLNGLAVVPVMLSFFASWMSNFTIYLLLGTIAIVAFCACYIPRTKRVEKQTQSV